MVPSGTDAYSKRIVINLIEDEERPLCFIYYLYIMSTMVHYIPFQ